MKYERVKYKLINHDNGRVTGTPEHPFLSNDPKNWENSDKALKRSTKTYGVYTELSKNLEFAEDGFIFLKEAYELKEIEANVTLEEWRMNPVTEEFYLHSTGTFDFSKYEQDEKVIKIPFKTGGLNSLIKSQLSEKFELERLESINGNEIDELDKKVVYLDGRSILLINELQEGDVQGQFGAYQIYGLNKIKAPNLTIISGSDPNVAPVFVDPKVGYTVPINTFAGEVGTYAIPNIDVEQHFYLDSPQAKTIRIQVKGNYRATLSTGQTHRWGMFLMVTNASYVWQRAYSIDEIDHNTLFQRDFYNEVDIELAEEENIALVFYSDAGGGGYTDHSIYLEGLSVITQEETIFAGSHSNTVLMHEAGEKLMQILTGEKGRYKSQFYGREDLGYDNNGTYAYTGLSSGFWIRKFIEKNIELSIKSFIESSNAIHNTGYTIETIKGNEVLVQEDMKYFFQDSVAIRITEQVSDIVRKAADDLYYSNMVYGYKKPDGDNLYEESMGLDEYNTRTGYTLPIKRVDNEYDKISEIRADGYGIEFARRKPKDTFPEEDTRYDSDVFILDLKEGPGTNLLLRKWTDDFSVAPLNVYSPETAFNLRLTPYRNSQRHEWFYSSGLRRFQDDYVRYANSIGNSEMVTQLIGESPKAENSDTLISTLEKPRFINQWIEFTFPVDYDLNQQVYGKTDVEGRKIPNYFFKVEFINEYNKKEYGYLFELQPNKEGKWRLLKAR